MYLIPLGMLLRSEAHAAVPGIESLDAAGFVGNLMPVIAGNLAGGAVLVALVYYVIYRRKPESPPPQA